MNEYSSPSITLRTLEPADLAAGLALSRAAGWNQTQRDWEWLWRLNPPGGRVAVKDGCVIGTVTTVRYEARFSWIGMVLVQAAERGQGLGGRLLEAALAALADLPSIKLDATPAGHAVYRKLGFVDEYGLHRLQTVVNTAAWREAVNPARPLTWADLPAVAAFDRTVFGADRRSTLEWLFEGAPEYAWVVMERAELAGYTLGRRGLNYSQLGPVVAREQQTARQLVAACLSRQAGQRFILDAAEHAPDWRAWLAARGFAEQRPFTRMFYRGNPYPGLPQQQFGILGPEFG